MSAIRTIFDTNSFGGPYDAGDNPADAKAPIRHHHQRHIQRHARLLPARAAYTASKQAIQGFSGSLAHELGHFNIRVKLVVPGYAPTTRFTTNAILPLEQLLPDDYMDFAGQSSKASPNGP